jgi:UDP-N-acetylmuramyl pentapeptide phosphotransferase/UDP-N-acetylglucosamine-1-phosphate transferase
VTVLVGFAVGALAAVVAWRLLADTFAQPLFARTNVRGIEVPVGAGVVIALAVTGVASVAAVAELVLDLDVNWWSLRVAALGALAFGLLGLFDDLAGDAGDRGFTGHLRAAVGGRLTTGGLKLFGGGVVAMGLAAMAHQQGDATALVVIDGLLIALAANLGNLFDRAPGRVTKVALASAVVLAAATLLDERLLGPAVVLGAAAGLLLPDLREKLMLGDAGANAIGAALGLGVVLVASPVARIVVLVVVLGLNALSEKVSFSAVIGRTAVLRRLDLLGRIPPEH